MKQKSELHTLSQSAPEGIDVISAEAYRTETSLVSADQAFELFHDPFQDYLKYYFCDCKKYANTPRIFHFHDHPFLLLRDSQDFRISESSNTTKIVVAAMDSFTGRLLSQAALLRLSALKADLISLLFP